MGARSSVTGHAVDGVHAVGRLSGSRTAVALMNTGRL